MAATDSADSSLHVGPPRHAASPHPTCPSAASRRTKTKFTTSSVVNDILWGRRTGMSARITRTSLIFMAAPLSRRSGRASSATSALQGREGAPREQDERNDNQRLRDEHEHDEAVPADLEEEPDREHEADRRHAHGHLEALHR